MNISMEQCINALQGFSRLSSAKLPFKQSYQVAKNIKELEKVVTPFEEKRNEYIKKLREESYEEDGKQVVPDDSAKRFKEDVESLLKEKIKIDIEVVSISSEDTERVSASDIKGCLSYIEMEE